MKNFSTISVVLAISRLEFSFMREMTGIHQIRGIWLKRVGFFRTGGVFNLIKSD